MLDDPLTATMCPAFALVSPMLCRQVPPPPMNSIRRALPPFACFGVFSGFRAQQIRPTPCFLASRFFHTGLSFFFLDMLSRLVRRTLLLTDPKPPLSPPPISFVFNWFSLFFFPSGLTFSPIVCSSDPVWFPSCFFFCGRRSEELLPLAVD